MCAWGNKLGRIEFGKGTTGHRGYKLLKPLRKITGLFTKKKYVAPQTKELSLNQLSPMQRVLIRRQIIQGQTQAVAGHIQTVQNRTNAIERLTGKPVGFSKSDKIPESYKLKHEMGHNPVHSQKSMGAMNAASPMISIPQVQPPRTQEYYNHIGSDITNQVRTRGSYETYNPRTGNFLEIKGLYNTSTTTVRRGFSELLKLSDGQSGLVKLERIPTTREFIPGQGVTIHEGTAGHNLYGFNSKVSYWVQNLAGKFSFISEKGFWNHLRLTQPEGTLPNKILSSI